MCFLYLKIKFVVFKSALPKCPNKNIIIWFALVTGFMLHNLCHL